MSGFHSSPNSSCSSVAGTTRRAANPDWERANRNVSATRRSSSMIRILGWASEVAATPLGSPASSRGLTITALTNGPRNALCQLEGVVVCRSTREAQHTLLDKPINARTPSQHQWGAGSTSAPSGPGHSLAPGRRVCPRMGDVNAVTELSRLRERSVNPSSRWVGPYSGTTVRWSLHMSPGERADPSSTVRDLVERVELGVARRDPCTRTSERASRAWANAPGEPKRRLHPC